jgi:hypothetical protein
MSQIRLKASCAAFVTPIPASSAPTSPIASASPLPVSDPSFNCSLITGNCLRVPSRIRSLAWGSPSRTNPSTVTNTSRSGKSETKA